MFRYLRKHWFLSVLVLLLFVFSGYGVYWNASAVFIGPDEFGVVVAHFGQPLTPGQVLAGPGQKGVREQVLGPGSHEIHPFVETVERFPIIHILPGTDKVNEQGKLVPLTKPEVGIVTSLAGRPLKQGDFLANPGEKGILKKVLVPGRYALNPYAYKIERSEATIIDAGSVGVVTHLVGTLATADLVKAGERGVLEDPIPPGLYWLNPKEFHVTTIKVGYQEIAFESGDSITFPSKDGDTIKIDATVVWGIMPGDAPHIVKQFGSEKAVVDNAIKPQAESKARVAGSNYRSREFVEGDSRERFQEEFFHKLRDELETKHVRVLLALVRNIEVPEAVRKPIQLSKIAVEEELTNRVRTETAKVQTQLNEIRATVEIESVKVRAETEKLALEEASRGTAEAARLQAETKVKVSEMDAEAAKLRGESKKVLGIATAEVAAMHGHNNSEALRKRFEPFGDANAYGLWRFAESLADNLKIEIRDAQPAAPGADAELLKQLKALSGSK
ncbi:MAG: hypothetical protein HY286_13025 [Planctomycetes bacterium]|nr:hypothetical protein [Planctomycetota bacterium]